MKFVHAQDSFFLDSLISLIGDSINTDDQTLTLGTGTATTSIIDIESSTSDITIQ